MERLVAARSAVSAGRRSSPGGPGPMGLRAGSGLRERTGRPGVPSPAVGSISAARSAAAVAEAAPTVLPAVERWADRPAFFFDLACPFSYLAAERIERHLGDVEWVPVPGWAAVDADALVGRASTMARASRLPLVWPDAFPTPVPGAMRAAAFAAEIGAGARFGLAALRLAFCGGFDLEKSSVLGDVAAAAGVSARDCLAAASEDWRDEELRATASLLSSQGVGELPVIGVDGRWFDGLGGLTEAAAWLRRG